ncbi:kinase [Laceyella putida]|uniref:Kinase n=1 Tax=Laceyella putida TaxID=110101 RepID=A0ABW2RJD1_9BACL
MEDNLSVLLTFIPKIEKGNRFVLGIDGLSRSGKTTLANKLSQVLQEKKIQVCVFHMDDYIVEREKRYNTGHEEWFEYYHLQWDVEWLKDHLFKKLKVSNQLNLSIYDDATDTHSTQKIKIPDTCVIIIEGIFLQRREWRGFYDCLVYLDCPRNKRFLRERDSTQKNIEKFRNRYWKAEDYYLKTEAPTEQVHLVLKN